MRIVYHILATLVTICAPQVWAMDQNSEQISSKPNNFIDANRGVQARLTEQLTVKTLGYHVFVLAMLKEKSPFASSEASLENKLNLAVEGFINAQNTKEFDEFISLCNNNSLPLQSGALERARKFIQQKISAQCDALRIRLQEDLGTVKKFQQMLVMVDQTQFNKSVVAPIEKPQQLFDMVYKKPLPLLETTGTPVPTNPVAPQNTTGSSFSTSPTGLPVTLGGGSGTKN